VKQVRDHLVQFSFPASPDVFFFTLMSNFASLTQLECCHERICVLFDQLSA